MALTITKDNKESAPTPGEMLQALDAAKNVVTAVGDLPEALQRAALRIAAEVLGHDQRNIQAAAGLAAGSAGSALIGSSVVQAPPLPPLQAEGVLRYTPQKRVFETIADLFHATDPKSDADRALVTGYWLQTHGSEVDFDSQTVNAALKDLGHGVGNITNAFSALIARRPQFVIQTKKAGTSRQARKRYKLTAVGISAVEQMMSEADRGIDLLP